MKRNYFLSLVIVSLFTIFFTSYLYADGVMISSGYTKESEQEGIIIHENGQETLILRVQFHGEPKDFAWIVPTPSRPEVDKASEEIFESLKELLAPYPIFSQMGMTSMAMAASIDGVHIIESKEIGIYNVTILSADTPYALSNWLREEEFPVPDEAEDIFSDYVNRKWFFVAIKINAAKLTLEEKKKIEEGSTPPLKFTFTSEKIVYPLKISSIASTNFKFPDIDKETETALLSALKKNVRINLYIFSNHKKEIPNFSIEYAGWFPSNIIKKLAMDEDGKPWFSPKNKMYLTILRSSMNLNDMKEDLFIKNAPDNKPVNSYSFSLLRRIAENLIFILLIFISPLGFFFFLGLLLIHSSQNYLIRALGSFSALVAIVGGIIFFRSYPTFSHIYESPVRGINFLLIGVLFILFAVIPLIIYEHFRYWRIIRKGILPTSAGLVFQKNKKTEWAVIGLLCIIAFFFSININAHKLFLFQLKHFTKLTNIAYYSYEDTNYEQKYQKAIEMSPQNKLILTQTALDKIRKIRLRRKGAGREDDKWFKEDFNFKDEDFQEALFAVKYAQQIDQENSLFDYLMAYLLFAKKKDEKALFYLSDGTKKDKLKLYHTEAILALADYSESQGTPQSEARMFTFGSLRVRELQLLRELARICTYLAGEEEKKGNHNEAIKIYNDVFKMGKQLRDSSTLTIGALVGIAIENIPSYYHRAPENLQKELPRRFSTLLSREYFINYLLKNDAEEFASEFEKESLSGEKFLESTRSYSSYEPLFKVAFSNFCLLRFWFHVIISNLLIWSMLGVLSLFGIKNRRSFQPARISSRVITSLFYFSFAIPIFAITAVMLAVSSQYIDVQGLGFAGTIFYFPLLWMVVFSTSVFIISFLAMAGDLKSHCQKKKSYFFWLQSLGQSILPKVIIFGLALYIITSLILIPMRRDFNKIANLNIIDEMGRISGEKLR